MGTFNRRLLLHQSLLYNWLLLTYATLALLKLDNVQQLYRDVSGI
jgi:hypothetical protein